MTFTYMDKEMIKMFYCISSFPKYGIYNSGMVASEKKEGYCIREIDRLERLATCSERYPIRLKIIKIAFLNDEEKKGMRRSNCNI